MKCTRGDAAINVAAVGGNEPQASRRREGACGMLSTRGAPAVGAKEPYVFSCENRNSMIN